MCVYSYLMYFVYDGIVSISIVDVHVKYSHEIHNKQQALTSTAKPNIDKPRISKKN